jgi:hypothetical protein
VDSASRREVGLYSKSKFAYRSAKSGRSGALDFYGIFHDLAAAPTPIEEYIDKSGQRYPGFRGQTSLEIDRKVTWKVDAKIWSDLKTKLPVRLELTLPVLMENGKKPVILLEQIEFDVPLDAALFDMTIPPDYTFVGIFPDQLKAPPNGQEAAKLTIVPGIGIGEVKFGMSREQIVAILGEPEFTMYDEYLCYASKGLQLVLKGPGPGTLGMIIANPGDAISLTRNEFPGQTNKGIRMGSSKEQVRDAYGEPDPPLPSDKKDHPVARYSKLGLMFGFADGKVQQISVDRTD